MHAAIWHWRSIKSLLIHKASEAVKTARFSFSRNHPRRNQRLNSLELVMRCCGQKWADSMRSGGGKRSSRILIATTNESINLSPPTTLIEPGKAAHPCWITSRYFCTAWHQSSVFLSFNARPAWNRQTRLFVAEQLGKTWANKGNGEEWH